MYNAFSELYDEWSRCYDPTNIEMSILSKYLDFSGKEVLEIGCGTGRFTRRIAELAHSIVAVDNDDASLSCAIRKNSRSNIKYYNCDALDLVNHINGKFDYIVFGWSLNYVVDVGKALEQSRQFLKKQGKIVILYTYLGEYELLLKSVTNQSKISDSEYENVKGLLGTDIIEDEIITTFVFRNIEEAMRLNEFFYIIDGLELSNDQRNDLRNKFLSHKNFKGEITVLDTVKVLIGG